ncbi:MAG: cytochrome P450 [Phycicoccus sp.]
MPKVGGFPTVDLPGRRRYPVLGARPRYLQYLIDPIGVVLDARHWGDVVAVAEGDPTFVFMFGEDNVGEVLADPVTFPNDEDLFTGPPGSPLNRLKTAVIVTNGEVHRRHRRHLVPPLRSSTLPWYAAQITELTAQAVDAWPASGVVSLETLTADLALRVAMRCFFGVDVSAGVPVLGGVATAWSSALSAPLSILAPVDLPGTPYRRTLRYTSLVLEGLDALVAQRRNEPPGDDALSRLIHDDSSDALRGDDLIAAASGFFVAGHETTAKTVMWTLFLLDQHPDLLQAVQEEIAGVLQGRPPAPEDLPRLVQLDAAVKESMRILPSVPLLFFRVPDREVTVGGHAIPPKANIVVSPLVEHRNPELYPEPRRFRPERWVDLDPGRYQYLPFGAGPRVCLGAPFATQAIRIMLAMILQRRRLHGRDDARVDRLVRTNILMAKGGLPMAISPADGRHLRAPRVRGNIVDLVDLGAR